MVKREYIKKILKEYVKEKKTFNILLEQSTSFPSDVKGKLTSCIPCKEFDITKEKSTVVYLKTDGTHMAKRLSQGKRPLIENGLVDWKRIYDERKPLYESVADLTIDCSGTPIKATVEEILAAISK